MQIPYLNLKRQYSSIQARIDKAVAAVLNDQIFVGGKELSQFETSFANAHSSEHAIGVGNASDALLIILKSLGINQGDEVIVPAHGWLSAAEMVKLAGADVIFVDVENHSFGIDPTKLKSKITSKTKAVIAIHLYGQICKIEEIAHICKQHEISLIEDCAQAHFASLDGHFAGQWGQASAFSFYPSKILGAFGDGGAILTNDEKLANQCRKYANHGGLTKNQHQICGLNSRLDSLQAAILNVKMDFVEAWINERNQIAEYYNKHLKGIDGLITPALNACTNPNFHIYPIQTSKRDALKAHLEESGIYTEIHYPVATPFTTAFNRGHKPEDFPVSFKLQNELLSLPIYPELRPDEMEYIVKKLRDFFD
jgi:dTDP-4-amino-4,6-dideoxygalactose transaminase